MMNVTLILIVAVCLLQLVDGVTTWLAISRGVGHESNVLVRTLMDWFGLEAAVVLTKGWVLVLVAVGWWVGLLDSQGAHVGLFLLMLFYVAIVVNNVKVLWGRDWL